jgi:transposase
VSELEILRQENNALKQHNELLKFQLAELRKLIYGVKSERYTGASRDAGQLTLFEAERASEPEPEIQTIQRRKPQAEKKQPVRTPIPAHLPRKETVIEPEGFDLTHAVKIGEEITEYLEYTPGKIHVEKIIRPKYKVNGEKIVVAELKDAQPIARSNAGPGLLAHILVSKYDDHLPLYRQNKMFKREGLNLPESTLISWAQKGMDILTILHQHNQKQINASSYLMADETPVPVLESAKPGSTHKGYYWVYYSPRDHNISFQYHKSRGKEAPLKHLKDFQGYLQTDGYAGYEQFKGINGITLMACMAHARRKFHEAKDSDPETASRALELFGELYDIEHHAREHGLSYAERYDLRQKESIRVLNKLEAWLKEQQLKSLPKSPAGMAINYTLSLWSRLKVYTTDGMLEIDNNWVENKIRPVAIGRKNYLFAGSHQAAERAGMIYSFLAMCRMADVNPWEWLSDVLKRINNHSILKLDELLPANWKALSELNTLSRN